MSKRAARPRLNKGKYATPLAALLPLLPHLTQPNIKFIEPCAGDGRLAVWLEEAGHKHTLACDIAPGGMLAAMALAAPKACDDLVIRTLDARKLEITDIPSGTTHAITNPPWPLPGGQGAPTIPIIERLLRLNLVVWCLLPADFMHNGYAAKLINMHGNKIVSIGRVKWFPGSEHDAMDNCCWFQFVPWQRAGEGHPVFVPKARFSHGKR